MSSTDDPGVIALAKIGRLLDEAIDLADALGETLLGAEIAQVANTLDTRLAAIRTHPFSRDHGSTDRSGGGVVEG